MTKCTTALTARLVVIRFALVYWKAAVVDALRRCPLMGFLCLGFGVVLCSGVVVVLRLRVAVVLRVCLEAGVRICAPRATQNVKYSTDRILLHETRRGSAQTRPNVIWGTCNFSTEKTRRSPKKTEHFHSQSINPSKPIGTIRVARAMRRRMVFTAPSVLEVQSLMQHFRACREHARAARYGHAPQARAPRTEALEQFRSTEHGSSARDSARNCTSDIVDGTQSAPDIADGTGSAPEIADGSAPGSPVFEEDDIDRQEALAEAMHASAAVTCHECASPALIRVKIDGVSQRCCLQHAVGAASLYSLMCAAQQLQRQDVLEFLGGEHDGGEAFEQCIDAAFAYLSEHDGGDSMPILTLMHPTVHEGDTPTSILRKLIVPLKRLNKCMQQPEAEPQLKQLLETNQPLRHIANDLWASMREHILAAQLVEDLRAESVEALETEPEQSKYMEVEAQEDDGEGSDGWPSEGQVDESMFDMDADMHE